jgi:hypothetical protein
LLQLLLCCELSGCVVEVELEECGAVAELEAPSEQATLVE